MAVLLSASLFAIGLPAATRADDTDGLRLFLSESFGDNPPQAQRLWLDAEKKSEVTKILDRSPRIRALRYWGDEKHSVWLLNEIGKERPITTAIEIENGKVKRVRVITYRESRGGEVQANWFLRQFEGFTPQQLPSIHRKIDSISGATLSVNALKKQVSLALLAASWLEDEATRDLDSDSRP